MSWKQGVRASSLPRLLCSLVAAATVTLTAQAQYPGKVNQAKDKDDQQQLRSIAVLEWTGDKDKPKASRLVPITVFDGGDYQEGGLYMARPAPLALLSETEYELQESGITKSYFVVDQAGRVNNSWFGYGSTRKVSQAKEVEKPQGRLVPEVVVDVDDDTPHLKRHPGSEAPENAKSGATPPTEEKPAPMKTKTEAPPPPDDPDRPKLQKRKPQPEATAQAPVESVPSTTSGSEDPDRPKLHRGKPIGTNSITADHLTGTPKDLQQMIAVSDAKDRPQHSFVYDWNSEVDQAKAKTALEALAWNLVAPQPLVTKSKAPAKPTVRTDRKKATVAAPETKPQPKFAAEDFRAFELAYGNGATMVFSGRTEGEGASQKFVTLVAETDLYGTPHVILQKTTDGSRLDQAPQLRLIDAVDANADNRAELLFELRSDTGRQFTLYKVSRGRAEPVFVTETLP